ncbi:hypothetical protein NDU88_006754 [Pleurodeles waltl]|uniref:Uncharacterized protein n=1 Tax=Pleurodeles waltl TaxID=8319 RepID=A0AAV7QIS6_PLEWA|nr:hypothetical protein NDU88_006754 [Pleurodeles waltl]
MAYEGSSFFKASLLLLGPCGCGRLSLGTGAPWWATLRSPIGPRSLPVTRSTTTIRGRPGHPVHVPRPEPKIHWCRPKPTRSPELRSGLGPKVSIWFTAADSQVWARYLRHCSRPGYLAGLLFSVSSFAQSLLFSNCRALRDPNLSDLQVPVVAFSPSMSDADAVLQAAFCGWGLRQASVSLKSAPRSGRALLLHCHRVRDSSGSLFSELSLASSPPSSI